MLCQLNSVYFVSACDVGFYGVGCSSLCPSKCSQTSCRPADGECSCPVGYQEPDCKQRTLALAKCLHLNCNANCNGALVCPLGKYGTLCRGQCRCLNGATCHHVTGVCSCAEGWDGETCSEG